MHLPGSFSVSSSLALLSLSLSLPHSTHAHGSHHAASSSASFTSIETLDPRFFPAHASRRIRATYGPYRVPSMHESNGMMNFGSDHITPPCTDCLITFIHAGLQYPNGTTASAANGMWLHHVVWTDLAKPSPPCPGSGARRGDRFFASGNERTPVDLTAGGTVRAGYEVKKGVVWAMGGELMNMRSEEREVLLTMTFEFIPSIPKEFRKVNSYWLDVGGCQRSDVPALEDQTFDYSSPRVAGEEDGDVVFTASHLHDGGTHAEIVRNGKVVCNSQARYGSCHHKDNEEEDEHIVAVSGCTNIGRTRIGDEWSITAYYDTTAHAPMRNMDGTLEPVMGISLVYVAIGKEAGRHRKVKIFLGMLIVGLSFVLVGMWAKLNGRDWMGRKKGIQLVEVDAGGKGPAWWPVGRYQDEE